MPLRFVQPTAEAYDFPLTINHLLDNVFVIAGSQEIIYRDQLRFTYRELRERIGRLASLLTEHGADEGMTVAVMDWDSHRYLEAYFAIPMMGAVLQTVNIRLPTAQIVYSLAHAKAQILLIHHDFFPLLETILAAVPGIRSVIGIVDGTTAPLPSPAVGEYEALSAAASPNYRFRDFDENAVATTFYTSGTTGNPKGVCFTHRQLVLHTLASIAPFGTEKGTTFGYKDVYMPLTPMFHVHAWGKPYVATMLGVKQVYPGRYEPAMLCRLRAEHKVSYSHCVPTVLQMVLRAADQNNVDLSGWTVTIGGAALSRTLCEEGRRRGMKIVGGYGMSETAPLIAMARARPNSDGNLETEIEDFTATVPVPFVSARVIDDMMNEVPSDGRTRGELVLRAPWLTPCYVDDAEASADLWHGGWMHTKDLATIDTNGAIRIRDRLKDVIKTGGEWIDSLAVEDFLMQTDGVAEVAVIAVPDPRWSERPLALVVPKPNAIVTLESLNGGLTDAIANGVLTRFAKLEQFELISELPRTSVGKIDKKLLRSKYNRRAGADETVQ
jgi:fatty-acyl-CoA synthase